MAPENLESTVARDGGEQQTAGDVLTEEYLQSLRDDSHAQNTEHRRFTENSLGKSVSPSTEFLKGLSLFLYDSEEGHDGDSYFTNHADAKISRSPGVDTISKAPPTDAPVQQVSVPDQVIIIDSMQVKGGVDNPQVDTERTRLEQNIDANITDWEAKARFKQDMQDFEKRAADAKPPLSAEEVAKTYREIARLLEAQDSAGIPLTQADRAKIAEQVMHHAADPSSVDQGGHGTCNVASIENRMYSRNPSAAAKLVTEVATTGSYQGQGEGTFVVVSPDSLRPDDEAKLAGGHQDGKRDHASQIFQVTAVNVGHERNYLEIKDAEGNLITDYPPGSVEYVQGTPDKGANPPRPTGELLIEKDTGEPVLDAYGNPVDHPYVTDDVKTDIYNEIAGTNPPESGIVLVNSELLHGAGDNVTQFKTQGDLQQELEKAKSEGRLPVILKVYTGQEPFFSDSGGNSAGGSGGAHVVTVTDYDPASGKVQIDNQWGKKSDHEVDIHDLYVSTLKPENAIKALEEECSLNAASGKVDYVKELSLLRLKHSAGDPPLSNAEYDRQLAWLTRQICKDAKDNHGGRIDDRLRTNLIAMFNEVHEDDPKRSAWLKNQVWETSLIGIQKGNVSDVEYPGNFATVDMEREVEKIYDADDIFDDDEEDVYEALSGKTPAQIRQMERLFQQKYGQSLESYLEGFLNDSEMAKARELLVEARKDYCPT